MNTSLNNEDEKIDRSRIGLISRGMSAFGNIFALNLCFLIGCIPIITIGASFTALYSMCIRLQENEEETIIIPFFHEFKRSFKQSTITFLLLLLAMFVINGEALFVQTFKGPLSFFYAVVMIVEIFVIILLLPFLFPLIARYNNTFWGTLKNSFFLTLGYFGSWIKIAVAWFAPVMFFIVLDPRIFVYSWYLWALFMFALIAWGTSFTVRKVFRINEERMQNTAKKTETEGK